MRTITFYKPLKYSQTKSAYKHYFSFLLMSFTLFMATESFGQPSVSISQSGNVANSCLRTLTAQVANGSGNYSYFWSIATPGITFPGPNNTRTVKAGLNQTTTFTVSVTDNVTSVVGNASTTVYRILLGSFATYVPNAFTPNNDGFNDLWMVMDGNIGYGPINAYYYLLTIRNLSNNIVYQVSTTINSGHLGLLGGDIFWNGRVNGTGNLVAVGTYTYSLKLQNCSASTTYNGYIDVIY